MSIQESLDFNETWWNNVEEWEPVTLDEIDEVKSMIASLKIAFKALEEIQRAELYKAPVIASTALSEINKLSGEVIKSDDDQSPRQTSPGGQDDTAEQIQE